MCLKLGLAVGMPLLLCGTLELGLRVGGFGSDLGFFIRDEQPGMVRTNPHFTELFLPASFGLKPVNFRLAERKPADTVRLFVLGESAAMGVPEPGFGLAPQMRARLQTAFPGRKIEVWNLGVTAINSHAIVEIARAALRLQPDLFVVYMGNNEVVGPYGASSIVTGRPLPLRLIRASVWLRSTRSGQLLQRAVGALGRGAGGFKDWRGMEMFAGQGVRADDPRLSAVYSNFAANLDTILGLARDAGVKTVLSTVAVNVRDCAPFVSLPAAGLSAAQTADFRAATAEARAALVLGDSERALAATGRALAIDPHHAETLFFQAEALEARGDAGGARRGFLDAREWDALRFRADSRLNAIIREAAAAAGDGVVLVDASLALGSEPDSVGRPAGRQRFFEHVHFNWEGNCALSRLLATQAARLLWGNAAAEAAVWPDDAACAASVGFTDLGRLAMLAVMDPLMERPPFTGQRTYAEDRTRLAVSVGELKQALAAPGARAAALRVIEQALALDAENPFLVAHAALARGQVGDTAGALGLCDRLATLQPPSAEATALRASVLLAQQRGGEAVRLLESAALAEPYYFQTYGLLAQAWQASRETAKGREYFVRLAKQMPDSRAVRIPLAQFHQAAGDRAAAEAELQAVLRLVPDEEGALAPLVQRLEGLGRREAALELMLAAYAYNPRSFSNNSRLVEHYETTGDEARTVEFMEALAQSGPVSAQLFLALAERLPRLGRAGEVPVALARARSAATTAGDQELVDRIEAQIEALATSDK